MVNINDLELKKILVGNPIKVNVEYKEKDKLAFLDRSDNLIAIGIIEDGMGAPKKVIRNVQKLGLKKFDLSFGDKGSALLINL